MNITRSPNQKIQALTLFEILVVVAIVTLLVAFLVPPMYRAKRQAEIIQCNNNLKQIGLAYRVWEGDNTNYPPFVSVTNGGTMELCSNGARIVLADFLVMSNELSTPVILRCPADQIKEANDFSTLTGANISYFQNLIKNSDPPELILSGDDNLLLNGAAMPTGISAVSTNDSLSWTGGRHRLYGNIGLADGSVQQVTMSGLQMALQQSGPATNQIAVP